MPYAVAHMLVPMLIVDLFRHKFLKIKKELPNRDMLIAGLSGLLPDIDIPLSFLFPSFIIHRGITHTVWVPLVFLLAFVLLRFIKKYDLAKIFLMIFIGTVLHVALDFVTAGSMELFYPLSKASFAIGFIPIILPNLEVAFVYAALDASLLFIWLARMMFRKKIQDVI